MNDSSVFTQHINLGYLMLMADGDVAMQKLMLSMLLDEIPSQLEKMNKAFEQTDWHTLRRLSHKMRTTLSFVGNDLLILANDQIAQYLKANEDGEGATLPLKELNDMIPKVLEEVKAVYETTS